MTRQVTLTLAGLLVFLVGIYLTHGFAAVLLIGGAVGFIAGLLWGSE